MIVPSNLLGILIGKEGINIKKLEQQNDGVTIHTQRNSTMIVIKGPVNSVQDTRGERLRNLLILREFLIILELLLVKWRNFINLME